MAGNFDRVKPEIGMVSAGCSVYLRDGRGHPGARPRADFSFRTGA
jgi:hypothetical protein